MSQEKENNPVQEFIQKCRDVKLSVTPQRLAIYKAILQEKTHPRPEVIHEKILAEYPTISLATVYKTLETFEKNSIISRVTPLHNTVRYDPIIEPHHHIICVECKKIIDVFDPHLDKISLPKELDNDYELLEYSVNFHVVCKDCRNKI